MYRENTNTFHSDANWYLASKFGKTFSDSLRKISHVNNAKPQDAFILNWKNSLQRGQVQGTDKGGAENDIAGGVYALNVDKFGSIPNLA